jgi:hypothetical protein
MIAGKKVSKEILSRQTNSTMNINEEERLKIIF